MTNTAYIGRFAPSPTGPLHFGSLVAAVASYCDAKANNGQWLVRMEDLDKPREVKGAANNILSTLTAYRLEWDGEVLYQSQRNAVYAAHLQTLQTNNTTYPCTCSRKVISAAATEQGIEGAIYPQTCLNQPTKLNRPKAWRIKTADQLITFEDAIQGTIEQNVRQSVGDFVVLRADQLFAYQLAVVVDDALQGITNVVRGADLLLSTPRQIYLQHLLSLPTPHYAHIPVIVNSAGEKLSKQTLAKPIEASDKNQLMFSALSYLNQAPPKQLANDSIQNILQWGIEHWQLDAVPPHNLELNH